MNKLLILLSIAVTCSLQAQTNEVSTNQPPVVIASTNQPPPAATNAASSWVAPITVQATAAGNRITGVNIIIKRGIPSAIISWEWVDAKGVVVRNGTTLYKKDQLEKMLNSKGTSIEMFKQLFLAIAAEEAVAPANQ